MTITCPRCGATIEFEERPAELVCGVRVNLDNLQLDDAHVAIELDDPTARRFALLEIE